MRFSEFEKIISPARLSRYLNGSNGNTQKAMTLYRKNLKLSQEPFTAISYFEVVLRNAINRHYLHTLGPEWLKRAANGGVFDNRHCRTSRDIIKDSYDKLNKKSTYSHDKLVAELGFGFWRFMFASNQFRAAGSTLLQIFPSKPRSSQGHNYNQRFVEEQLKKINNARNRIAHHEPMCFGLQQGIIDTAKAREDYAIVIELVRWMGIDPKSLLYGLDHTLKICDQLDQYAIPTSP